jgi:hypothetical protein
LAVGHERLRHRAQGAGGELGGLGQVGGNRVAAAVQADQAVVVAVVPGRVGVQQPAERGRGDLTSAGGRRSISGYSPGMRSFQQV